MPATMLRRSILLVLCFVMCAGCVQRRFTVRTNPPGALVYIDDQEIGTTPTSTPFTYYGTRKIQIVKDGYETLTVRQKFKHPWYQWPGIDFVAENLYWGELRDERVLDFTLQPQYAVPTNELMSRAERLRTQSSQGMIVAPPPAGSGTVRPLPNAPPAQPGPIPNLIPRRGPVPVPPPPGAGPTPPAVLAPPAILTPGP